jgi:hypothetical protein
MNQMNISWRPMRLATGLFGVLLALSVACNGGPTEPSLDDLVPMHTGRWKGTINGWPVVLDVRAQPGNADQWIPVGLDGTGTALNPATGESHSLTVFGQSAGGNSTFFSLLTAWVIGPGGVILGGGKVVGLFEGAVSDDGRTWPGRWRVTNTLDPLFGLGEGPVTLIKE